MLGINSPMQPNRPPPENPGGKPRNHNGADFIYGDGSDTATEQVLAVLDGRVHTVSTQRKNGKEYGWGNFIILDHRPYYVTEAKGQRTDGPIFTVYAHLKSPFTTTSGNVKVKVGNEVKTGQPIAIGNNSGTSTGGHLHFEIIMDQLSNDAQRVKPTKFFTYKFKKK